MRTLWQLRKNEPIDWVVLDGKQINQIESLVIFIKQMPRLWNVIMISMNNTAVYVFNIRDEVVGNFVFVVRSWNVKLFDGSKWDQTSANTGGKKVVWNQTWKSNGALRSTTETPAHGLWKENRKLSITVTGI